MAKGEGGRFNTRAAAKRTSIGKSRNTRATSKSQRRSWKKYRGQGKLK